MSEAARPAGDAAYAPRPARVSRRRRVLHRLIKAGVYAVGTSIPVAAVAFVVRSRWEPILHADEAIIRAATDYSRERPSLVRALLVWEELLQPKWVYIAGTLVCIYVWKKLGLGPRALWAFLTMMVSWNLALDIKILVQRARPVVEDAITHAPGYSFPSGHAANSAAASTILVLLFWPRLSRRGRALAVGAAALVIVVTAVDRVMLGVHYPSDVTAGVIFGVGLALASYAGYRDWGPWKISGARPDPAGGRSAQLTPPEA
ncbi:MAG TPA: phosphatase PAP2 family protein [Dermatophilaceae bacterium]|nr:phosphatase PAP2 family protein [Dermatophilaceae bacterium]